MGINQRPAGKLINDQKSPLHMIGKGLILGLIFSFLMLIILSFFIFNSVHTF